MSERCDRCVVALGDPDNHIKIHGLPDRLAVLFHVDGGSLTPNLKISLRDLCNSKQVLVEMVFRSFSHTFSTSPNPRVNRENVGDIDEFSNQVFGFSHRFFNFAAVIRPQDVFDPALIESLIPGNFPILNMTWRYRDVVVFRPQGPFHPDPDVQRMVNNVRQCFRYSKINVWVKAIVPLVSCCFELTLFITLTVFQIMGLKFFLSQPVPPPPAFLMYAQNVGTTPLESATISGPHGDPQLPQYGNEIEALMRMRVGGWTNLAQGDEGWYKHQAHPFPAPMYYVDERHFEAWQHSTMMREHQFQKFEAPRNPKFGNCNGRYSFDLEPVRTTGFSAPRSFSISIRPRGDQTQILLPIEGTHVSIDAEFPLQEDEVENIHFDAEVFSLDRRQGRERIDMVLIWSPSSGRIIASYDEANNTLWQGEFHFGQWGSQTNRTRAAIQFLMYGHEKIRSDTWLKHLLLGQRKLRPFLPTATHNHAVFSYVCQLLGLNQGQQNALKAAVTTDDCEELTEARQFLCQGPPGTGKTQMIVAFIIYCMQINRPVIVVANSNYALDVIGKRLHRVLQLAQISTASVFHLRSQAAEQLSRDQQIQDVEYNEASGVDPTMVNQDVLVPAGQGAEPFLQTSLSEASQQKLDRFLSQQISIDSTPFSIAHYIRQRRHQLRGHLKLDRNFAPIYEELLRMRLFAEASDAQQAIPLQGASAPQPLTGDRSFEATYLDLQKFYLAKCRVCLVTADSAAQRALVWMNAFYLIADEASQLKDHQLVNAAVRHLRNDRLLKWAQFGDPNQLGPNDSAKNVSEFSKLTQRSTMQWRIELGDPYHMLTLQYRSHPEIADFVSREFYAGRLQNDASVLNRPFDTDWQQFINHMYGLTSHNIFIDVTGENQLYRLRDGTSCANPDTIGQVVRLLREMDRSGLIDIYRDVMIISFYSAQEALLRSIVATLLPDAKGRSVDIRTVEGSMGDEKKVVILDFVRPGPTIGLIQDPRRLCVAFSRAVHAMIGIGTTTLGHSANQRGRPSKGAQILGRYIGQHVRNGTCVQDHGNGRDILRDFLTQAAGWRVFKGGDEEH